MNPLREADLESILQQAWELVRAEPGWSGYLPGSERIERALTFRLGVRLCRVIDFERHQWPQPWDGLTVDSELHRAHNGSKLGSTQAPDLVVHVRGTDAYNLLAIEAKHALEPDADDVNKLRRLRVERGYRCTWAVRLDLDGPLIIRKIGSDGVEGAPVHRLEQG